MDKRGGEGRSVLREIVVCYNGHPKTYTNIPPCMRLYEYIMMLKYEYFIFKLFLRQLLYKKQLISHYFLDITIKQYTKLY